MSDIPAHIGPPSREAALVGARRRPVLDGRRILAIAMVLPATLLMLAVTLYPLIIAVQMSFMQWKVTSPVRRLVGLHNYTQLITADARFLNSIQVTVLIVFTALALEFLFGLGLALLFWGEFRFKRLLTTLMLIPMMISPVVVGFTARMGFTVSYGFVNQILSWLTFSKVEIQWLSDPGLAPIAIILADVWQWTSLVFLILLAGLMSLPQAPLEAARVDGASSWQSLRYIVLPQLRYFILVALLIRGLDLLKLFDVILLATRAGPGIATETITVYIYTLAFRFFNLGYAAAAAFLLLIGTSILATVAINQLRRQAV